MATRELKAAYQASSTRQAIARAIRAEVEDGAAILDAEKQAYGRVAREGTLVPGTLEPTAASKQLASARHRRESAEAAVRERWGMPPMTGQAAWRESRAK